jgi:hypothetical protein
MDSDKRTLLRPGAHDFNPVQPRTKGVTTTARSGALKFERVTLGVRKDCHCKWRKTNKNTWGAEDNLVAQGTARAAYLAALRALDATANDIQPLLLFARR